MDNTEFYNLLKEERNKRQKLSGFWKRPFQKALEKYFKTTDPCDNAFVFGNVRAFYRAARFYLHMEDGIMNSDNELVVKLSVEIETIEESEYERGYALSKPLVIKIPAMLIRYFNQKDFDKWVYSYWTTKRNKEKAALTKIQKLVDKFPAEAKEYYERLKQEHRPN